MSTQAKQLKDVPVIDIGADTPVLALDSSGAVGKGTLHEAVGRCSNIVDFPYTEQGDWWRIANINFCGVGIICISELWTQSPPRPVVLGVVLDAYPGGNDTNNNGIKVLAGKSNRISKIRFVVDVRNKANSGWLDICIPHTDKFKSRRTQIASYGLGIRPVKLAEAPSVDNAYFVKEFDMTALQSNSGGVISCTAIGPYLVAYKEKGGPHEHGRKDSDCEVYLGVVSQYADSTRIRNRFRHMPDRWSVFLYDKHSEPTGRNKHLWPALSAEFGPVWDSNLFPMGNRNRAIPVVHILGIEIHGLAENGNVTSRKEVVAA